MTETKREKWGRLMEARLPKAQSAIRIIGNLATPNYEWSPEMSAKVIFWLRDEINKVEDKFKAVESRRAKKRANQEAA